MAPTRVPLFACAGSLCVQRGTRYDPVGDVDSFVLSIEEEAGTTPTFAIIVRCGSDVELEQVIDATTSVQFHIPTGSVFWYTVVDDALKHIGFKFCVDPATKLAPSHAAQTFVEKFNRCLYACITGMVVPQANDDNVDYLGSVGAQQAQREAVEEDVFSMDKDVAFSFTGAGGGKNTCFADSVQYNRALVFQKRGQECFVQAHAFAEDGFTGQFQEFKVADATGQAQEALLQHGDKKMYLIDSAAQSMEGHLRELDLVTGSIVQTYEPSAAATGIKSVKYMSKFANESPNLLSCITGNSAFVVDTRLDPKACAVVKEGDDLSDYSYKSLEKAGKGNAFTCHATSRNGFLAIGDQAGGVRLYTGPPGARKLQGSGHHAKLAKTLIDLGTPILHLDITSNGEYVIVTTSDRILVLCTLFLDDKGSSKNGFEARMGKNKPAPLSLLPSPAQVLRMGGADKVKFVQATLEDNEDGEQWIAAVSGPFVCTWNMARVKEAVTTHSVVYCEAKDTQQGNLLSVEMKGKQNWIGFLTDKGVGFQRRSSEKKKQQGGFTFFSD